MIDDEDNVQDVPFAEWSDTLINKESWDVQKDYNKNKVTRKGGVVDEVNYKAFQDEQILALPISLIGRKWLRIKDVFPNVRHLLTFYHTFIRVLVTCVLLLLGRFSRI